MIHIYSYALIKTNLSSSNSPWASFHTYLRCLWQKYFICNSCIITSVSPINLMVSWRHFTALGRKLGSFTRVSKLEFFAKAVATSGHPFGAFEDWLGVTRKRFRYRKIKSAISILNDGLYKVILVWLTCTGGKDFKSAAKSRQESKAEIGSSSVLVAAACNKTTTAVP